MKITCPSCQLSGNIPDDSTGKSITCKCGCKFSVESPFLVDNNSITSTNNIDQDKPFYNKNISGWAIVGFLIPVIGVIAAIILGACGDKRNALITLGVSVASFIIVWIILSVLGLSSIFGGSQLYESFK